MLLEGQVDLRVKGITSRMALQQKMVNIFIETGEITGSLLADHPNRTRAVMELDHKETDGHGTEMASILLAGLPEARLHLFNATYGLPVGIDATREALDWALTQQKPKVVTIARMFAHMPIKCEDIFPYLFDKYRDETLFVIAAGNFGQQGFEGMCPQAFAGGHDNVLLVSGTDDHGAIHRESNWGVESGIVTAPYCGHAVDIEEPSRLKRICGTSFAAATVSNAALRLASLDPSMTAPALARSLISDDANISSSELIAQAASSIRARAGIQEINHSLTRTRREGVWRAAEP